MKSKIKTENKKPKSFPFFLVLLLFFCLGMVYLWFWSELDFDSMKKKSIKTNLIEMKEAFLEKHQSKDGTSPQKTVISSTISYSDRIEEAEKLIENQYYTEASIELNKALKTEPDKIYPYLLLGEIHIRHNNPEKLENLIRVLEHKFPQNNEVLSLQTRKWIGERKYDAILTRLGEIETLSPELLFYQSVLLTLQQDFESARETLTALEKFPVQTSEDRIDQTHPDMSKISPSLLTKIQGFNQSFEKIDQFNAGKNPHLFVELSKILAENNEAVLAFSFADIAVKEDPQYTDAWILRGYGEFLQGHFGLAEKDLFQAYQLDPLRPEASYFLALALTEMGNQPKAILYFEKALEYDFEFSNAVRWKLVDILIEQKKYSRALEIYQELIPHQGGSEKFSSAIHTALKLMNEPSKALEFTEVLIQNKPKNVAALNLHAWVLMENKNFLEAEKFLKSAQKLDKKNPQTALNFGLLFEGKDNFSKAKKYYQKSYEFGKSDPKFKSITDLATQGYNRIAQGETGNQTLGNGDGKLPSSP